MSDWYDSLEDESDEKNSSSDSLKKSKTNEVGFPTGVSENKSTGSSDPFYLSRRVTDERPNFILNFPYDEAEQQKKNFLPKIETTEKGWNVTPNLIIDNQLLKEQGLQINNDGSFTKSPRSEADELPFITREYRNLQFQKKKTYRMTKKAPRLKSQKTNFSGFSKNPDHGTGVNKRFNENLLLNVGSLSPCLEKQLKLNKQLLANDNLTDSMKEKLLQSSRDNSQRKLQIIGSLKKTKRVMNLLETPKTVQKKFINQKRLSPRISNMERKPSSLSHNDRSLSNHMRTRNSGSSIAGQHSEITLNGFKPTLSYAERRQLESGFSPLHLRLQSKKVLSETSRSDFGDSVAERLSEVSSRVLSCENIRDDDEESFYRELMEKDKMEKLLQRSSRSENPNELSKLRNSSETGYFKDQKEAKQNNFKIKPISKSLSIDLSSETESRIKKNPHYCSAESSPKMSKFELALKAKTYGYLANARNIFKMKAQSEGKLTAKEADKNREKHQTSVKKPSGNETTSKHFPSKFHFPEVQEKFPRALEKKSFKNKPSRKAKNSDLAKDTLTGFFLPRVVGAENRDTKIQTEILNRMSKCLNTPNVTHRSLNKAVHGFLKTV